MHSYSSLNSPIKRVLRLIQISNQFVESDRPARTNYSTEAFSALMIRINGAVDFNRAYRMSPACFASLLARVKPSFMRTYSTRTDSQLRASRTAPHALAITLRILAGAMYVDVRMVHRCSAKHVYRMFWKMCASLADVLKLDFWRDFPERAQRFGSRTGVSFFYYFNHDC